MKKALTLSLFFLVLLPYNIFAQNVLWGGTKYGGSDNAGTIFYIDPTTEQITKVYEFKNTSPGNNPVQSRLEPGPNNTLWGMTSAGGDYNKGVIFEWLPDSNNYIVRHHFNDSTGAIPTGSLHYYNNKFYGMTSKGGSLNKGVIFEFSPVNNSYSKKFDFDIVNGADPQGSFIQFAGLLYAMTTYGGQYGQGVIFSWDATTDTQNKLFEFDTINGIQPFGDLTVHNGSLYGMTRYGGNVNSDPPLSAGVIFHWDIINNIYVKDWEFPVAGYSPTVINGSQYECPLGCMPLGTLLSYNGKLYGTAMNGGEDDSTDFFNGAPTPEKGRGVLFEWNSDSSTYTLKKTFYTNNSPYGEMSHPQGALITHNGKLYGALLGTNEYYWQTPSHFVRRPGLLFEWDLQFDSITNAVRIGGSAYGSAEDRPINAPTILNGRIFAITQNLILEWNPANNNAQIHRKFSQYKDGAYIQNSLYYRNGKLYGQTSSGGDNNTGTFFEFDIATNRHQKHVDFYDYSATTGELTFYDNKLYGILNVYDLYNLYNMPNLGYRYFQWDFNLNSFSMIAGTPYRELFGSYNLGLYNNKFYHISRYFQFGSYVISSFDPTSGIKTEQAINFPVQSLYFNGKLVGNKFRLYGLSINSGTQNQGSIFEINPTNGNTTTLHSFNCTIDGCSPNSAIEIIDGIFYGLTASGGNHNKGVLFAYDKGNAIMQVLHHFDGTTGEEPLGQLLHYNGKLYGMTSKGGSYDAGVVFIWDIQNRTFRKIADFDGQNGAMPKYGKLVSAPLNPTAINEAYNNPEDNSLELFPLPTQENLNVSWKHDFLGDFSIEICNALNQTVFSKHYNKADELFSEKLNLKMLETGWYQLKIFFANAILSKPIIIAR